MRFRGINLAMSVIVMFVALISGCGSGNDAQIADLEREVDELENRIAATASTPIEPAPLDGPTNAEELASFTSCIDLSIAILTRRAQSDIDELHQQMGDHSASLQDYESGVTEIVDQQRIQVNQAQASIIQMGGGASGQLAVTNLEREFEKFKLSVDLEVRAERSRTAELMDQLTDQEDDIEQLRDQAIEDLEVARQAAAFGPIDWSTCSSG